MYRLTGPIIIIFIPLVIIGIICVALTPNYFTVTRILSFSALLIGEAGLSFIPVLAFYPKATPLQGFVLALIYFCTTLIICFGAWAINSLGITNDYSFILKEGEFQINTYCLFETNIFSAAALLLNFRLIYDEELTKEFHNKAKKAPYKKAQEFKFAGFQSSTHKKPKFEEAKYVFPSKEKIKHKTSERSSIEEELLKPFEFEPEIEFTSEELPEESSGKLQYKETNPKFKEKRAKSDFFEEEEGSSKEEIFGQPFETTSEFIPREKPKPIQLSPFPPQDIKKDLQAIFEQYSSLNAVKKLTSGITDKPRIKRKEHALPKQEISVHHEGDDIHEATFRQVSEEEKIKEIKEELKKELREEIEEKLTKEVMPDKTESKEKFEEIKEEFKKELKELKEEIKSNALKEKDQIPEEETIDEIPDIKDNEHLKSNLLKINNEAQVLGSAFLKKNANLIIEEWKEKQVLHKKEDFTKAAKVYRYLNDQVIKTNQGGIYHILLESEGGTTVIADMNDKLLTVYTEGTGEVYCGQILRALQ